MTKYLVLGRHVKTRDEYKSLDDENKVKGTGSHSEIDYHFR